MDGSEPLMRLDGSMIDVNEQADGTRSTPDPVAGDHDGDGDSMEVGEDLAQNHGIEETAMEEPFTPATDNTGSSKSLPGSGRVTPSSQSDQSIACWSSEKSTPSCRLKSLDGTSKEFDNASTSSGSIRNIGYPPRAGINWRKGERLEAMDYLNTWFPAKIKGINEEEMKVLIHFDGWNQRYDEWIDMNSDRIRPLIRHSERKEKSKRLKAAPVVIQEYKVGDQVYAKWTDCKMYPAKVTNVLPTGLYEVIFYDGFKKLVQPMNMRPMTEDAKAFEVSPVPDTVLKKIKVKLDTTGTVATCTAEGRSRSKSTDKTKKEKPKVRRKRQTIDSADLASIANSLEKTGGEDLTSIPAEPIPTQTESTEKKAEVPSTGAPSGESSGGIMTPYIEGALLPGQVLPPKAFVVQQDHNPFKCHYEGCNKGFRKEHLLEYHIKYYHLTDDEPIQPPKKKKRRKTISMCSTESESGSKKAGTKKHRNLSAEGDIFQPIIKQEFPEGATFQGLDTDDFGSQTSPIKHPDSYASEDSSLGMKQELKADAMEDSSLTDGEDFLKPDELVNCICDFQEENGLMIQCEVCMCWQHAACFGITERTLPKTYVCFVCENPPGVRESSRYVHEQDWYKTGEITGFKFLHLPGMSEENCSTVKSTHNLISEIHQLNTVLHSLRLQLKILRGKDESKLKQWRVDWDVVEPVNETMETCLEESEVKDENKVNDGAEVIHDVGGGHHQIDAKDEAVVKQEIEVNVKSVKQETVVNVKSEVQQETEVNDKSEVKRETEVDDKREVKQENEVNDKTETDPNNLTTPSAISGISDPEGASSEMKSDVKSDTIVGKNNSEIVKEKQAEETVVTDPTNDNDKIKNANQAQRVQDQSDNTGLTSLLSAATNEGPNVDNKVDAQLGKCTGDEKLGENEVGSKLGENKVDAKLGDTESGTELGKNEGSAKLGENVDEGRTIGGKSFYKLVTGEMDIKLGKSEIVGEKASDIRQNGDTTNEQVNGNESGMVNRTDNNGIGDGLENTKDTKMAKKTATRAMPLSEMECEEGTQSDSTESIVEDPLEICEKNLLSHILRVQAEISDRLDKIEDEVNMLEAMEAFQTRKVQPPAETVLDDMPGLKRSMKYLYEDLTKVKKMAVFH